MGNAGLDPCPSTANADALAQLNRDQRKAAVDKRSRAAKNFLKDLADAKRHYNDFHTLDKACLAQSIVTEALILMLAPEEEVPQAGEAPGSAYSILESLKLLSPQGLSLVANVSEKLVNGEDPSVALLPEVDQMLLLMSKALSQLGGMSPDASAAQVEQAIEGCAGTIGVSAETKLSADKYVEDFQGERRHAQRRRQCETSTRTSFHGFSSTPPRAANLLGFAGSKRRLSRAPHNDGFGDPVADALKLLADTNGDEANEVQHRTVNWS